MRGPCNATKPDQRLWEHLCLCRLTSGHDGSHACECGYEWPQTPGAMVAVLELLTGQLTEALDGTTPSDGDPDEGDSCMGGADA